MTVGIILASDDFMQTFSYTVQAAVAAHAGQVAAVPTRSAAASFRQDHHRPCHIPVRRTRQRKPCAPSKAKGPPV